jgi:hypothetical protein
VTGDAIGGREGETPRHFVEHCPPVLPSVDETFLAAAPTRFAEAFDIALPASAVWAELTRDGTLDWCRGLEIRWLSPRPFGVGTRRQAKLFAVLLRVREEYFIWEEGRRMAFFVTAARPPAYRRSAEDYVVEALGADRCRFTWTLAFDLTLLGKLNGPLMSLIVKRMFADTRHHFEQLAAQP